MKIGNEKPTAKRRVKTKTETPPKQESLPLEDGTEPSHASDCVNDRAKVNSGAILPTNSVYKSYDDLLATVCTAAHLLFGKRLECHVLFVPCDTIYPVQIVKSFRADNHALNLQSIVKFIFDRANEYIVANDVELIPAPLAPLSQHTMYVYCICFSDGARFQLTLVEV